MFKPVANFFPPGNCASVLYFIDTRFQPRIVQKIVCVYYREFERSRTGFATRSNLLVDIMDVPE
jgi:hypothetical protein